MPELNGVVFRGAPRSPDATRPAEVPSSLWGLLGQINGFVAFRGGLHVRGWCDEPSWHSLDRYWRGEAAIESSWAGLFETDLPFGEDCMGDQFLLREDRVHRLSGETGEIEATGQGLNEFLDAVCADPVESLRLEPLLRFEQEGSDLEPGRLLMAYPPFCTKEGGADSSIRSVPTDDLHGYLSTLARDIANLADGDQFRVEISD